MASKSMGKRDGDRASSMRAIMFIRSADQDALIAEVPLLSDFSAAHMRQVVAVGTYGATEPFVSPYDPFLARAEGQWGELAGSE
jgi:hypothetical protein